MSGSTRFTQNPDGSYRRTAGRVMEGSAGDEPAAGAGAYDEMTKAELEDLLESRGLPKTGNKDELQARLEEDDAA
jgi:hypothetical protein